MELYRYTGPICPMSSPAAEHDVAPWLDGSTMVLTIMLLLYWTVPQKLHSRDHIDFRATELFFPFTTFVDVMPFYMFMTPCESHYRIMIKWLLIDLHPQGVLQIFLLNKIQHSSMTKKRRFYETTLIKRDNFIILS